MRLVTQTTLAAAAWVDAYCNLTCPTVHRNGFLAFRMVESDIARGQGAGLTSASTGYIQLGLFQQALREAINTTTNSTQKSEWNSYLHDGIISSAFEFQNATANVERPLDRFSLGTSYLLQGGSANSQILARAIDALEQSAVLQPRNANDGLWYYDNTNNLSAYHNLSYLDGMFSYAPFAILAAESEVSNRTAVDLALDAGNAWEQLGLLYKTCRKPSGLLVHGYDPTYSHPWAENSTTGASPEVWGRSFAWYTLGLLNSLQHLSCNSTFYPRFRALLNKVLLPQITAAERSFNLTGQYGVWQVVDKPGDEGNFIEASASCMTVYSMLRAARLGLLDDTCDEYVKRARNVALGIYDHVLKTFLGEERNGTLTLNGTSTVASLSGDVSYDVSRAGLVPMCVLEGFC